MSPSLHSLHTAVVSARLAAAWTPAVQQLGVLHAALIWGQASGIDLWSCRWGWPLACVRLPVLFSVLVIRAVLPSKQQRVSVSSEDTESGRSSPDLQAQSPKPQQHDRRSESHQFHAHLSHSRYLVTRHRNCGRVIFFAYFFLFIVFLIWCRYLTFPPHQQFRYILSWRTNEGFWGTEPNYWD